MSPTTRARVGLLDGFALEVAESDVEVRNLPHGVQRLIAHVSLSGRPRRGAIAGQLWPDVCEDNAASRLRSTLWRLHKSVPGLVQMSGGSVRLADGVRVDVDELTCWARRVLDPHVDAYDVTVPDIALHGELLPGWYDDWVLLERERLRQLRLHALEILAGKLARVGRYGEALQAAMAAVRAEPLRESAHRVVMRVHLAEGNLAEAAREYNAFRCMIADELGVAPSPQMDQLIRDVPRLTTKASRFTNASPRNP